MAGHESGDCPHSHDDMEYLVVDGEEYVARPYSGCPKCSIPDERLPFYEVSMKESLEGKKTKYPVRSDVIHDSCADSNIQGFADHLKRLELHLRVSKDSDRPTHGSDCVSISEPDTQKLEQTINHLELYLSSLKSKLQMYKQKESHQPRGDTLEPLQEVEEGREDELGPEHDTAFHSGDEMETSGGDITVVHNDPSDQTPVVGNEARDIRSEIRNKASGKGKKKSSHTPEKGRRDKAALRVRGVESSESASESTSDESEVPHVVSSKSGDEEVSRVKKISKCKQGREGGGREQSPGHSASNICDSDNNYAELEIHSGAHASSSIKGRISIRKHHVDDEDLFEDNTARHRGEKRRCLDPEEKSPVRSAPSEFGGSYPAASSQRSVESETTESSLYETAKDMSSQASDGLFDSSGSVSP